MSGAGRQAPEEVLEKIKKLLNLAGKNPNEHEAAAAMAKAQGLMEQWNLDAGSVERATEGPGKRQEEMTNVIRSLIADAVHRVTDVGRWDESLAQEASDKEELDEFIKEAYPAEEKP